MSENGKNYVLETLDIEIARCERVIRVEEEYSAYPEYQPRQDIDWKERKFCLEQALEKLQS